MADTLHELLSLAAARVPDHPAIIDKDEQFSYVDLYRRSTALAISLAAVGVEAGTPVGLCIPKSANSVVAAYGIMMSGACYVPIDPFTTPDRAARVAENVGLKYLVTTVEHVATLGRTIAEMNGPLNVFTPTAEPDDTFGGISSHSWSEGDERSCQLPYVESNQLAYILHTSGSTGKPKGVAITHHAALSFVEMAADYFDIQSDDRLCSQAPLQFDLSVFDLYVASCAGATLILIPEFYSAFPKKMVDAISDFGITVWNSVSSTLALMMEKGSPERVNMDSLRLAIFSGDVMPLKYLRDLRKYMPNAELYNGYGQTEANTSTAYKVGEIPSTDTWRIPIGKAFPGIDVFLIDSNGSQVESPGVEGEIYVCADTVAAGYWDNPQETRKCFVPDPRVLNASGIVYRTGDTAQLDQNSDLIFVGRTDDMIKSGGYRIELGDIDQVLLSCAGVSSAAAVAVRDDVAGKRVQAFVSPVADADVYSEQIIDHCRAMLPNYMVPQCVVVLTDLPRTATGKVDRDLLKKRSESGEF